MMKKKIFVIFGIILLLTSSTFTYARTKNFYKVTLEINGKSFTHDDVWDWSADKEMDNINYNFRDKNAFGFYRNGKTYSYHLPTNGFGIENDTYYFTYNALDKSSIMRPGENYLVKNGNKTYGPYNYIYPRRIRIIGNRIVFTANKINPKTKEAEHFLVIDGKEYGPYKNWIGQFEVDENNIYYRFITKNNYMKASEVSVYLNGKIYGPYIESGNLLKKSDSEYYFYSNGKIKGPYEKNEADIISLKKENYNYIKNGKAYIKIDGKKYGPHEGERVNKLNYLNNDNEEEKKDVYEIFNKGKRTLYINGKDYSGPHNNLNVYYDITDGIIYSTDKYIYANNKKYGPYESPKIIKKIDNDIIFSHKKNNKNYINIKGIDYGPYNNIISRDDIEKIDNKIVFKYYENGIGKINVGGEEKGKEFDMLGFISKKPNENSKVIGYGGRINQERFYFIKGKSYKVKDYEYNKEFYELLNRKYYQYKKGSKYYVYMNGEIAGPYNNPVDWFNKGEIENFVKYTDNGKKYLYYNKKTFGPFKKLDIKTEKLNGVDYMLIDGIKDNGTEIVYLYKGGKLSYGPIELDGNNDDFLTFTHFYWKDNRETYDTIILHRNEKKYSVYLNGKKEITIDFKDFIQYDRDKATFIYKTSDNIKHIKVLSIPAYYIRGAGEDNSKIDKQLKLAFESIEKKGKEKAEIIYKRALESISKKIKKETDEKKKYFLKYARQKIYYRINNF